MQRQILIASDFCFLATFALFLLFIIISVVELRTETLSRFIDGLVDVLTWIIIKWLLFRRLERLVFFANVFPNFSTIGTFGLLRKCFSKFSKWPFFEILHFSNDLFYFDLFYLQFDAYSFYLFVRFYSSFFPWFNHTSSRWSKKMGGGGGSLEPDMI